MSIAKTAETINGFSPEQAVAHLETQEHFNQNQVKNYQQIEKIKQFLKMRRGCDRRQSNLLQRGSHEQ